jgi:environmental stress-induced protein Ves
MRVVRGADAARVRWRNNGGWTREVARSPANAERFDWRVSIAEVEANGPFSAFDGYDRILVLLSGAGMNLHFTSDGTVHQLREPLAAAEFAGEAAITATLAGGPTTDLNLIWRRTAVTAVMSVCDLAAPIELGGGPGEVVIAHVVSGSMSAAGGRAVSCGETAITASGEPLGSHLDGLAVLFVLTPVEVVGERSSAPGARWIG